ncbi:MAG: sodium-dependent bicarbonate transport family permease [Planctomycetota bacterium]
MQIDLLLANLTSPPILFFVLGIAATLVRSDLSIPEPLPKLFSLYLLWAIGFKGGVSLRAAGLDADAMLPLIVAVALSAVVPVAAFVPLRSRFNAADACAIAAAYGSVSVVTFITASNFLDQQGIPYGGHLVAALALMESPAIITAVLMYRVVRTKDDNPADATKPPPELKELLREAVANGPVFLLLGSLLAGVITGDAGWTRLRPFCEDIFHGVLVLFLLESGMTAARSLSGLRKAGIAAPIAGIVIPLISAAAAIAIAIPLKLSVGDAFLLMILAASASYIAVPAAMRLAIPEANSGVYLPMALGITFPFNIALGIPMYLASAQALLPDAAEATESAPAHEQGPAAETTEGPEAGQG